jgi:ABC-type sulfate transport system substrate-binding protein
MCRAGFPGHFGEPWSGCDGVEIDFIVQYKHLTDVAARSDAGLIASASGASRQRGSLVGLSAAASAAELLNVSYDPTRELYVEFNAALYASRMQSFSVLVV